MGGSSTTEAGRLVTPIVVASIPSRRTDSRSLSSWVKTITWRLLGHLFKGARQSIDAWVHGLHRVVHDNEPERAFLQCGAREEKAQCECMKLALAHDTESGSSDAVDGDIQRHAPRVLAPASSILPNCTFDCCLRCSQSSMA